MKKLDSKQTATPRRGAARRRGPVKPESEPRSSANSGESGEHLRKLTLGLFKDFVPDAPTRRIPVTPLAIDVWRLRHARYLAAIRRFSGLPEPDAAAENTNLRNEPNLLEDPNA